MNILLVDDDPKFRTLMKRLLEKKFFASVTEADNGIMGLDIIKKVGIHIIFLDYEMPHMNGKQFLQKLREFDKVVPVAIMTSHSEKEIVQELLPYGITDYIIKADMLANLTDRLGQIFSKNRHLISRKL